MGWRACSYRASPPSIAALLAFVAVERSAFIRNSEALVAGALAGHVHNALVAEVHLGEAALKLH